MNIKAALVALAFVASVLLIIFGTFFFPVFTGIVVFGGMLTFILGMLTIGIYKHFKNKFESKDGRSLPVRDK